MSIIKSKLLTIDFNVGSEFGELITNKGGFNFLNIPDNIANSVGKAFFNRYNKPWLEAAINRGDDIILATRPINKSEYIDVVTGKLLGNYSEELQYLVQRNYKPINLTSVEWNNIKSWY